MLASHPCVKHLAAVHAALPEGVVNKQRDPEVGRPTERSTITLPDGTTALELWMIEGAGHAWSGGDPAGSYTDPRGPNASAEMIRFFLKEA